MARSGRFGRLPRRAPDLSASIVAMMREYWSMQENLMVEAWKNGGSVDGKQVTDQMLLAFWKDRRDSFSRDDPMWDYYNNVHDQYDFNIAESKVSLQYAQKKMSAREVAKWYKGQAQNYPQDSEVYRTIMGQAARFLDAARASSSADSAKRRTNAFQDKLMNTFETDVWGKDYLVNGLVETARAMGYLSGSTTTQEGEDTGRNANPAEGLKNIGGGADLTSLAGIGTGQDEIWGIVLGAINDPTQLLSTGQSVQSYFQTFVDDAATHGVNIGVPLDMTDIEGLFTQSNVGIDKAIALAEQYHDVVPKGFIEDLRNKKILNIDEGQFIMSLPFQHTYAQHNAALESVLGGDSNGNQPNPFDIQAAFATYLGFLSSSAPLMGAINPVAGADLQQESRDILGYNAGLAPTIAEGALFAPFTQSGLAPTGAEGTANEGNAARYARLVRDSNLQITQLMTGDYTMRLNDNTGAWETVPLAQVANDTGGQFVYVPRQKTITVIVPTVPTAQTPGRGDNADTATGATPAANVVNAAYTTVTKEVFYSESYKTIPIIMQAPALKDPTSGLFGSEQVPLAPGMNTTVGQVAYLSIDGGPPQPVYGIYINGRLKWSTDAPWTPGQTLGQTKTADGLMVTANMAIDPANPGANPNIMYFFPDGSPAKNADEVDDNGNAAVATFNPHGANDPTFYMPGSTRAYDDPFLSLTASTESGRDTVAKMNPQVLFQQYQHDPFIDWSNEQQVQSFWQDIITVRSSAAQAADPTNPLAALGTDLQFWAQLAHVRNNGRPDPWIAAITAQTPGLIQHLPQILHNIAYEKSSVWNSYQPAPFTPTPQTPAGPDLSTVSPGTVLLDGMPTPVPGAAPTPTLDPRPGWGGLFPPLGTPAPSPTPSPGATPTPTPGAVAPAPTLPPGMVDPTGIPGVPQLPSWLNPFASPTASVQPTIQIGPSVTIPGAPHAFPPSPSPRGTTFAPNMQPAFTPSAIAPPTMPSWIMPTAPGFNPINWSRIQKWNPIPRDWSDNSGSSTHEPGVPHQAAPNP